MSSQSSFLDYYYASVVSFKQQWCCRWWWWGNLRGHCSCLNNKVYYKTIAGQDGCLGITRRRSQSNRSLKWQGRAHRYIGRLFFSQTWEKITLHIWFSTESGNEHTDHSLGRDLVWNTWRDSRESENQGPTALNMSFWFIAMLKRSISKIYHTSTQVSPHASLNSASILISAPPLYRLMMTSHTVLTHVDKISSQTNGNKHLPKSSKQPLCWFQLL